MKRVIRIALFSALLLAVAGCGTTAKDRLAYVQKEVTQLQTWSAEADLAIRELRTVIATTQALLADPNAAADPVRAQAVVTTAQQQLEAKFAYKATIDAKLAEMQRRLAALPANPDVSDEVGFAGVTMTSVGTTVGGVVGGWIALGGVILTALATAIGSILKARAANGQLAQVVAGGEVFKQEISEMAAGTFPPVEGVDAKTIEVAARMARNACLAAFKRSQNRTQSPRTRATVTRLRAQKKVAWPRPVVA